MKSIHRIIALAVLAGSLPAFASTVAYWRFEEGPADANVPHPGTGGVWSADTADSSGNSNELSVWTEGGGCGFAYRTDVAAATVPQTGAANNFSVQNTGGWPAMWTETGTALQSWTPAAWTIEAAFQTQDINWRSMVGRDSFGGRTDGGDGNVSALYLQITPGSAIAIKYLDVDGVFHEAYSANGTIKVNNWYATAAVCDGSTLSLYLKDITGGGDYDLVAQATGMAGDTRFSPGHGDGGDWDAGNFTVGRGLYGGGHGDRWVGFIDEVRLSDVALAPSEFLFVPEPTVALLALPSLLVFFRRRR